MNLVFLLVKVPIFLWGL